LEQKRATWAALRSLSLADQHLLRSLERIAVILTAHSIQKLDDDNLAGAVKYYRDEVARFLEIDDANPRVRFIPKWAPYRQSRRLGVQIDFIDMAVHLENLKDEIEAQLRALGAA
jgi:hypothetical protein